MVFMTTILRRSARLQQSESCNTRSEILGARRKKRRLLPSPSTSGSFGKQQSRPLESLEAHPGTKETTVIFQNARQDKSAVTTYNTGGPSSPGQKRKRPDKAVDDHLCDSIVKRTKSVSRDAAATICISGDQDERHPIEHWARTQYWPKDFSKMSQEQSDSSKKRRRESSYTQSTKDGNVPKAHTRAFEVHLARHGILMEEPKGRRFLSEVSKRLCEDLLKGQHEEPRYTLFPLSMFLDVCDRLRTRNEYRIFKDITPVLVPSAELLFIGGHDDLEHVTEEVSADWTKSDAMGGPKPRPDFAVGIASSAFTDEEVSKLKNHTAWERATLFTDNMYFPFLLCEAKCGDQGINRADRQNAQSGSMAVNAVIQLYQVLGDDRALPLSGQILAFSVSHDNERVKIYGHYAVIEGTQTTFYRYPVESFTLNFHQGQGRKRTSDFVREVYEKFFPVHLQRIRDALAKMDDPHARSMTSSMSLGDSNSQELDPGAFSSQELDPGAFSSQETVGFKKPDAPASQTQKGEMALLREQLARQEKQYKEQMARQERQYKEQMAQQEKQMAQQNALLKQLLDAR